MRVFVTHNSEDLDAYFGRALPALESIDGVEVTLNRRDRDLTTPELIEAARGCQVIIAHRSTPGEAELFDASPDLVAFLRCAVDISTIDVESASSHGILVARAAKSFIPSTAELALGLLLAVSRSIAESTVDYRNGSEPPQRPGRQLRDQTAGIIGYGSIGSYLADLLVALGMRVLVHDPQVQVQVQGQVQVHVHAPETAVGDRPPVEQVGFDRLLADSDVVFPLAPAQPSTVDLIDETALAAMKPGAVLINVSRGELVNEEAVAAALDSGQLGGLGMDVGRASDQRPSMALAQRPGVVATPHLGGLTPENADAQAASAVEQVAAMVVGQEPPRAVNLERADRLRVYWNDRGVPR
ncbi:MAG: hydroxyacid dehydrogenase [Acidimicrobiia bacterium]|nr:hydroxyacid dehydrogenase [Acidimicrobiia bacterium]